MKIATISPKLKVANTEYNADEIIRSSKVASSNGADMIIFPELSITGATCGDLFLHKRLYEASIEGAKKIIEATKDLESTIVFGTYLAINEKTAKQNDSCNMENSNSITGSTENTYYDCILIAEGGCLMGVVPKMKSRGFAGIDFGRWFADGVDLEGMELVETELSELPVAFGDIVFEDSTYGIDVMIKNESDIYFYNPSDEDMDAEEKDNPLLVINPTAESTQAGLNSARIDYYNERSKANNCSYAFVSPGVYESSTDLVFSGQSFVVSEGEVVNESRLFARETVITYSELNTEKLTATPMADMKNFSYGELRKRLITGLEHPLPFIPSDKAKLDTICGDAFTIQASALATRIEHINSKKALIGISGGLDSTLALLVTVEAFKLIGKDLRDIITVTMPGFGTSDLTFGNAHSLMQMLGTDLREISIVESVKKHFDDIGHDIENKNKAYENAQARERTQILMDIANDEDGIVIGTGDLSESALGWCTYGGDHLAMYGVNGSIPKTLIPYILMWVADNKTDYTDDSKLLSKTLNSIIETPISPELLPADERGQIAQKTEDSVGPYELHDYFIYHTILSDLTPDELLNSAEIAFNKAYDRETISKWLKTFYSRFFSQQFKRNCSTEGPMATQISLSPRGGLTMPSDASASMWLNEIS